MSNNKTIGFSHLTVEITRRCNMACRHCFRGEAQNIDMPHEVIDALLDKAPEVQEVVFTGGEPLLNWQGIDYFVEAMKKREMPLYYIEITTNGTILNNEIVAAISRWADYVRQSLLSIGAEPVGGVIIRFSEDKYHAEQRQQLGLSSRWGEFEASFTDPVYNLKESTSGVFTQRIGRGKNLPDLEAFDNITGDNIHEVVIFDKYGLPYNSSCHWLHDADGGFRVSTTRARKADYIVGCSIDIDAKGNVYVQSNVPYDCIKPQAIICNVLSGDDMLDAVLRYNRGASPCAIGGYAMLFSLALSWLPQIPQISNKDDLTDFCDGNGDDVCHNLMLPYCAFPLVDRVEVAQSVRKRIAELQHKYAAASVYGVVAYALCGLICDNWDEANKKLILMMLLNTLNVPFDTPLGDLTDIVKCLGTLPNVPKGNFERKAKELNNLLEYGIADVSGLDWATKKRLKLRYVKCSHCGEMLLYKGKIAHATKIGNLYTCDKCGEVTVVKEVS